MDDKKFVREVVRKFGPRNVALALKRNPRALRVLVILAKNKAKSGNHSHIMSNT